MRTPVFATQRLGHCFSSIRNRLKSRETQSLQTAGPGFASSGKSGSAIIFEEGQRESSLPSVSSRRSPSGRKGLLAFAALDIPLLGRGR